MMNKSAIIAFMTVVAAIYPVGAENIAKNTARMQAMDKITGRVSEIDIPVNGKMDFGSFSVVVRSCQTRSAEEIPDNFAFVDVADMDLSGKQSNIFKGWMISSSPATSAVEHPIYDVWLIKCLDTKVDKSLLLSQEELDKRDMLPSLKAGNKQKAVAALIDEMQYDSGNDKVNQPKILNAENMMLEFEMDEETPEENSEESSDESSEESSLEDWNDDEKISKDIQE